MRRRLRAAADPDLLVLHQLLRALDRRDPAVLGAAMDSLARYPAGVRDPLEAAIVGWLMATPPRRAADPPLDAPGPPPLRLDGTI